MDDVIRVQVVEALEEAGHDVLDLAARERLRPRVQHNSQVSLAVLKHLRPKPTQTERERERESAVAREESAGDEEEEDGKSSVRETQTRRSS